jgi:fibronectin type 3 domain-containing protein
MHRLLNHSCRVVYRLLLTVVFVAPAGAHPQGIPAGTAHSVTLTWQAPSPVGGSGTISGYNVYRSPSSTATYAKLNTALAAGPTFTDSSVSAGASYTYCVTTVDSLGEESVCSAPATANVPSNPNAPSAPLITVK